MRLFYWFLAGVALALVALAFAVFASPDSQAVAADTLDQWYLQNTIIGAILGAAAGAGAAFLAFGRVHSRVGEPAAGLHARVVRWGLLGALAGLVLTLLVTLQLAYGRADWPLAPAARLSLVAGAGRYLGVLAAAWVCAAVAYAILVSTRDWAGRGALTGR